MTFSTVIQNIIKIMSKYWDVFLIKGVSVTLALAAITVLTGAYTLFYVLFIKKDRTLLSFFRR